MLRGLVLAHALVGKLLVIKLGLVSERLLAGKLALCLAMRSGPKSLRSLAAKLGLQWVMAWGLVLAYASVGKLLVMPSVLVSERSLARKLALWLVMWSGPMSVRSLAAKLGLQWVTAWGLVLAHASVGKFLVMPLGLVWERSLEGKLALWLAMWSVPTLVSSLAEKLGLWSVT
jgi:hypothetical protein